MREPMTIAIIGCGRFSPFFVPLFKAHRMVKKVYVCDIKKDREENFAKRFGVDRIESFEAALASKEINAVAIFTQRFKHGPMVIEALKAGKHVYSAVPCALKVEEMAEIARLVKETRLTYSMGETGYYRAPAIFCRREFKKGTFGRFVYGEAQYNHDIRNMENSFKSSGGDEWRKYAGIPPLYYPTHSTSMILSAMPGVYAKKVTSFGFKNGHRTDIYGTEGQNLYNNPFSNMTMLLELSNGGIVRINENRCVAWRSPETYISQFYGNEGCYEFSVAHHHLTKWDAPRNSDIAKDVSLSQDGEPESLVKIFDVTPELTSKSGMDALNNESYQEAIQKFADGIGFTETTPVQNTARLPQEFIGLDNRHNGTHHFIVDDFCRAYATGKLSPTNIWEVARYNIPGIMAFDSAMEGGKTLDVVDLGDPPADWEVLTEETMEPYEEI